MFDCLKHEDVKAINENKEPSKYQLGKLVPCNIQFESGKPKEIGYLFPFDPTSGYRKIEISGCQREFVYKVTVMENTAPCDDLAQPVFDDLGQEDFATADLVDVFEKVKETPQDWLDWMANRKKTELLPRGETVLTIHGVSISRYVIIVGKIHEVLRAAEATLLPQANPLQRESR